MSALPVPAAPNLPSQDLPWSDPIGPDARLLGRLATLLSMMSTEAAQHPEQYRNPPDWRTLTQLHDVLLRVAATPDPLGYLRQAMQQWRTTWATRGSDPEPVDPHVLYVSFHSETAHRQTLWRAEDVYTEGDSLIGPEGLLAVFHLDSGMWVEPDGTAWPAWLVAPLTDG
jgi:hypothetical protein